MNKHFDFNIINSLKNRIKNNNKENTNNTLMKNFKKTEEFGYISFVLHTHLPYISHPEDDRISRRIMAF